jgi:hypothetical protein
MVQAYNGGGTADSNVATVEVTLPPISYAAAESTTWGTLSGSYLDTVEAGDWEALTEVQTGGKPASRTSRLRHDWRIDNVVGGALVIVTVDAAAPANGDGDDFRFAYSPDGQAFVAFATLDNGTGRQLLTAELPSGTAGTVFVRLEDSDRSAGRSATDSVLVYRLYVESIGDAGDLPPEVTILEPADGLTVNVGTPVAFVGEALDAEDGDLAGGLAWSSSLDQGIGGGAGFSTATSSVGTHTITASVTDSAGRTGSDEVTVVVVDPNARSGSHVDDLDGAGAASGGGKWSATVTVAVHDNAETAVAGALVSGSWSNGASGGGSCTTDAAGRCQIAKGGLKQNVASVAFSIAGVIAGSLAYAAGANHDPDGDSDGTAITVARP